MINSKTLKIHTKSKSGVHMPTKIPVIRLEGKWLKKLGFNEGQMINVTQEINRLIITIDDLEK